MSITKPGGAGAPWRGRVARLAVVAGFLWLCAPASAQVTTMELAWDASPSPTVTGYRVYVGFESGVYFGAYDIPNQTTYSFVGALVGVRYYYSVAARDASGALSARSNEVTGIAESALQSDTTLDDQQLPSSPDADTTPESSVCDPAACTGGTVIAQGTGSVAAMTPLPDGRLMYVENGRRLQIAGIGRPSVTAFQVDRSNVLLHGLALDPDFAQTGTVYLGETAIGRDGSATLGITRYRERDGVLGEGVGVVYGLPASPHDVAPFAVDAAASLYVAIPSSAADGGRFDAYAGQILAFDKDGRVRPEDGPEAPIIGPAGQVPASLFWDPFSARLWLAAADSQSVTAMDVSTGQPPAPVAEALLPVTPAVVALARNGTFLSVVFTSEGGKLYRTMVDDDGRIRAWEEFALPGPGHAVAVAAGSRDEIYVTMQDGDSWAIVQLPE